MAWFFELAAYFDRDRPAAERFARFFQGIVLKVGGPPSELPVAAWVDAGHSGSIWAIVCPEGLGTSGSGNPEDARQMTEAGQQLYQHLRSAPPYRFALVGVEVFDWRDVEDLPPVLLLPSQHGLVLAEPLWESFGRPVSYIPFAPGYVWRPYRGEGREDTAYVRDAVNSGLMKAARDGKVIQACGLIIAGADINARDSDGMTPLMHGAHSGHLEIVSALVERGARINDTSDDGRSAMTEAVSEGNAEVVEYLIDQGADTTQRLNGLTLLDLARSRRAARENAEASVLAQYERIIAALGPGKSGIPHY